MVRAEWEGGICYKNYKKCPERAMLCLSEPVDKELQNHVVFFRSQKVQVARSYALLKLIDFCLLMMATRLSLIG